MILFFWDVGPLGHRPLLYISTHALEASDRRRKPKPRRRLRKCRIHPRRRELLLEGTVRIEAFRAKGPCASLEARRL